MAAACSAGRALSRAPAVRLAFLRLSRVGLCVAGGYMLAIGLGGAVDTAQPAPHKPHRIAHRCRCAIRCGGVSRAAKGADCKSDRFALWLNVSSEKSAKFTRSSANRLARVSERERSILLAPDRLPEHWLPIRVLGIDADRVPPVAESCGAAHGRLGGEQNVGKLDEAA